MSDAFTVLLVEDNDDLREALAELLEEAGVRVLQAANGRHALEVLESHPAPGAILLDIMMPEMNGHDFWKRMQTSERFAPIPVIVMSAQAPPSGMEQLPFLKKPVLGADVMRALGRS